MGERPVRIAVFYARPNERHREKFHEAIADIVRHGVQYFDDRDIAPGQSWKQHIFDNLDSADIVVLLLTPEFVASRFCIEEEVPRALKRHAMGACRIFPVKVASFYLVDESPLREIQWFPSEKPVAERGQAAGKAWVEVAKELHRTIKRIKSEEQDGNIRGAPDGIPSPRGAKYGPAPAVRSDSDNSNSSGTQNASTLFSVIGFMILLIMLVIFLSSMPKSGVGGDLDYSGESCVIGGQYVECPSYVSGALDSSHGE